MAPMRRKGYARVSLANAKKSQRKKKARGGMKKEGGIYKAIVNELVNNQLHVFQYPFSTRTKYPKIPDGLLNESVGLNFSFSERVVFDPAKDLYFLLYPGHTCCVSVFQVDSDITEATTIKILTYGKFIQHLIPRQEDVEGSTDGTTTLYYDQTGFSGYRYVSCGMRLTSDMGEFDNNGVWQAIRIPTNAMYEDFNYNFDMQNTDWNTVLPNSNFLSRVMGNFFDNNPGFQSGAVKTMDDYEFRLRSNVIEHNIVNLPEVLELNKTEYEGSYASALLTDGIDNKEKMKFLLDESFDMILVKVNTSLIKQAVQVGVNSISYNVSANIELTPHARGHFSHFATESLKANEKFYRLQEKIYKDSRLPGYYNFNQRYRKHM